MNHYPEVASFVRDRAHVERYTNLKVKYIDHHNPDLVLLAKDGSETHRVDLTRLSSTHSIHKLCQLLGLKEICRDENGDCRKWASSGECERNPDFMSVSCRHACSHCSTTGDKPAAAPEAACRDLNEAECPYWFTMGECESNPAFMKENCAKACGVCADANKDEL